MKTMEPEPPETTCVQCSRPAPSKSCYKCGRHLCEDCSHSTGRLTADVNSRTCRPGFCRACSVRRYEVSDENPLTAAYLILRFDDGSTRRANLMNIGQCVPFEQDILDLEAKLNVNVLILAAER